MNEKIDIIIADDHKLFRKGIAALLSDFEFIGEINEAENGIHLLRLLNEMDNAPDIILLDIRMPEMDGIEAQKRIRSLYPEIKIIILSMEDDDQIVLHDDRPKEWSRGDRTTLLLHGLAGCHGSGLGWRGGLRCSPWYRWW